MDRCSLCSTADEDTADSSIGVVVTQSQLQEITPVLFGLAACLSRGDLWYFLYLCLEINKENPGAAKGDTYAREIEIA